ncbi:MAG TPA: hypothetical protein O0X56_01625 [Methanocorpusculum sp.]|nr:hypothetical protein [Methanocorpusculum sp.]
MMIQRKKKSDIAELIQKIDECNSHLAVIQERLIDLGNAYTIHSASSSIESVRSHSVGISTICISLLALIMSMVSVFDIIGLEGMFLILGCLFLILLLLIYVIPVHSEKKVKRLLKKTGLLKDKYV